MIIDQVRYSATAMFLHWLMAILMITLFGLEWYMVDSPKGSEEESWFFALHKSIGLTMALLAMMRLNGISHTCHLHHLDPLQTLNVSSLDRLIGSCVWQWLYSRIRLHV